MLGIAFGIIGVLWAIIGSFSNRYANRNESDVKELAQKHEELYKVLISTQEKNTDSTNRLSIAVDRLTNTVSHLEIQASERHDALSKRIDDLHKAEELIRLRIHWIMNKITVLKFSIEGSSGKQIGGDWNSP